MRGKFYYELLWVNKSNALKIFFFEFFYNLYIYKSLSVHIWTIKLLFHSIIAENRIKSSCSIFVAAYSRRRSRAPAAERLNKLNILKLTRWLWDIKAFCYTEDGWKPIFLKVPFDFFFKHLKYIINWQDNLTTKLWVRKCSDHSWRR